jgi:hypothetical protein
VINLWIKIPGADFLVEKLPITGYCLPFTFYRLPFTASAIAPPPAG